MNASTPETLLSEIKSNKAGQAHYLSNHDQILTAVFSKTIVCNSLDATWLEVFRNFFAIKSSYLLLSSSYMG